MFAGWTWASCGLLGFWLVLSRLLSVRVPACRKKKEGWEPLRSSSMVAVTQGKTFTKAPKANKLGVLVGVSIALIIAGVRVGKGRLPGWIL